MHTKMNRNTQPRKIMPYHTQSKVPIILAKIVPKRSTEKPFDVYIGDGVEGQDPDAQLEQMAKDFDSRLKTMEYVLVRKWEEGRATTPMSLASSGVERAEYRIA